jgi:hypothetical protein
MIIRQCYNNDRDENEEIDAGKNGKLRSAFLMVLFTGTLFWGGATAYCRRIKAEAGPVSAKQSEAGPLCWCTFDEWQVRPPK